MAEMHVNLNTTPPNISP